MNQRNKMSPLQQLSLLGGDIAFRMNCVKSQLTVLRHHLDRVRADPDNQCSSLGLQILNITRLQSEITRVQININSAVQDEISKARAQRKAKMATDKMTQHTAKFKDHRCTVCGKRIPKGAKYWSNETGERREHSNCLEYEHEDTLPQDYNSNRSAYKD